MHWSVYIIETRAGTLYTGVSTDVERRFREHSGGARGARYLRGTPPRAIVFVEGGHTRASACRREAAIKRLSRARKLALIAAHGEQRRENPAPPPGELHLS